MRVFILISLLIPICVTAGQREAIVTLSPSVEIDTVTYRLGDIADVYAEDESIKRQLERVPVGYTPRVGYRQTLDRDTLKKFVESRLPKVRSKINWSGTREVHILGKGRTYPAKKYIDVAKQYLYEKLGAQYSDVKLVASDTGRDLSLTGKQVRFIPRTAGNLLPRRRMCVWVDVLIDGERRDSVPVWFAVSAHRQVLVAKQTRHAGQGISKKYLNEEYIDITQVKGEVVEIDSDLTKLLLIEDLPEGSVLTKRAVTVRPDVVKGRMVSVRVDTGKIVLTTAGFALRDGNVGDVIRIMNKRSATTYLARVTDMNTVETIGGYHE